MTTPRTITDLALDHIAAINRTVTGISSVHRLMPPNVKGLQLPMLYVLPGDRIETRLLSEGQVETAMSFSIFLAVGSVASNQYNLVTEASQYLETLMTLDGQMLVTWNDRNHRLLTYLNEAGAWQAFPYPLQPLLLSAAEFTNRLIGPSNTAYFGTRYEMTVRATSFFT